MQLNSREVWWLAALEATLFLSLPCWESTATWAEPVTHPLRFGLSVLFAATAAMFACHLGPAALATKFGQPQHRFSKLLIAWLGVGYLAWILSSARVVGLLRGDGLWLGIALLFMAMLTIAAGVRRLLKSVVMGELLLGAGILTWALTVNWHGLWARNSHYSESPPQFDWLIVKGMLLSAAPVVVIAWSIGRIESRPYRIWLSGFFGVWLPLVLSVTIASLAAQAGATLHYVPSLPRGFNWALLGSEGRLTPSVIAFSIWTMFFPALVSAVSLRELVRLCMPRPGGWIVPIITCLLIYGLLLFTVPHELIHFEGVTPTHEFWAGSLVVLGVVAGVAWVISRRSSIP